ncbi:MAG: cytochrome P450 [Trueperaceae bacterium]|nr:cytochrome P450 [Trueperaceae bacterium]
MSSLIAEKSEETKTQGCPIDHSKLAAQKTARASYQAKPGLEQDAKGVWHIYGYAEARNLLRAEGTKQGGFNAEELERLLKTMRDPILYLEGEAHRDQRTKTARFFTPTTTDSKYRQFMEAFADELIDKIKEEKRVNLSDLSMQLAVQVAAQVVGLTNSRRPGMSKRIEAFFHQPPKDTAGLAKVWGQLVNQVKVGNFFFTDVQPAIQARKKAPQEDVISHTLSEGYKPLEILTECVTFASAGMATTREFISLCTWHMLENEALKQEYLAGDQKTRYKLLHELLRLEPVVGTLYRRATQDLSLDSEGQTYTIPKGSRIVLHLYATNTDEKIVDEAPTHACPARTLPKGVPDPVMSFGDGNHRCPGAYIAIQETDIFLSKLLRLEGLSMEKAPELSWNDLVSGYELRNFILTLA